MLLKNVLKITEIRHSNQLERLYQFYVGYSGCLVCLPAQTCVCYTNIMSFSLIFVSMYTSKRFV